MKFEWDENKNKTNMKKHGFDFLDVVNLFKADHIVLKGDNLGNDENRWIAIGLINDVFITVIYTIRGKNIRIISARRSRHGEEREYRKLYG